MDAYYHEIASYLDGKYQISRGYVVDIGCGKGTFLKTAAAMFPGTRGLGVDPSYEPDESHEATGRLKFLAEKFTGNQVQERPDLIVCRHVLEHIPQPIEFLRLIHSELHAFPDVPVFIEVPDLRWTIRNGAFWDFCYEHCNYFSDESIARAVELGGFSEAAVQYAFGNQYLWTEAINTTADPQILQNLDNQGNVASIAAEVQKYEESERNAISSLQESVGQYKEDGYIVAIWGMATKGVLLVKLVDPDRYLVDFCIDINTNKQGRFTPVTGHEIQPPEVLLSAGTDKIVVIVMNPNYIGEIQDTCRQMLPSEPLFVSASGVKL
jgi:hypothetical protein